MYRHLLVPVDGTPLSASNVNAAITLAGTLGARITFFHATPDYAAAGEGPLVHRLNVGVFSETAIGATSALLLKTVASAQAAGITAQSFSCVSDHPAEAIVEAAASHGADLIVMASRGLRGISGWLHSSQTERVLRRAAVALLVTRVESNEPLQPSERALAIIEDEHRSIAVVTTSLHRLASQQEPLDSHAAQQIGMLVSYLREFPQRLHHPKEEEQLHRLLRARHPESEPVLAELERQHAHEIVLTGELMAALDQLASAPSVEAESRVRKNALELAAAIGPHMSLEEVSVFPLARTHLSEGDWAELVAAFENEDDPHFGDLAPADFDRMFRRISSLKVSQGKRES